MSGGFATIGHSNRTVDTVINMLREANINIVVDVRSFPKSRSTPDFNDDTFPKVLVEHGIDYLHMLALGGRRPKQPDIDEETNGYWKVRGFHNYADYALGSDFQQAFRKLVNLGRDQSVVLMCSEAVWWRCHRRIITDYLLLNGYEVLHLMAPGRSQKARPTESAKWREDRTIVYPPMATKK